jgi:pyruvate dehydrogenase E2 component (dihydrolipoamide acetyltransferase)
MFEFYRSQKPATGCTINDVITLACGRVIGEMPAFRSQIQEKDLIEFPHANIGIAVGVEEGLVVPVVLGVENRGLADLAGETKRVVELARNGRLEGVGKGIFTITNLGMFGVDDFAAIINPPEAAILAISAVREEMIVSNGQATPGRVMTMTLSTDHRIIDGVTGAQFLGRLKEILEAPEQLAG